jgi:hypothetical protein
MRAPDKTCHYCQKVGPAYTFSDGETVCPACFRDLPVGNRDCHIEIVRLRKLLADKGIEWRAAP